MGSCRCMCGWFGCVCVKVPIACMRGQQHDPAEPHSAPLLLAAVPGVIAGVSPAPGTPAGGCNNCRTREAEKLVSGALLFSAKRSTGG